MNTSLFHTNITDLDKKGTWIIIALFGALMTALSIADTNWLYLGALFTAPALIYLSIKKPVIFPFGFYVFLIPVDMLLPVTGTAEGAKITKLLGVLTILVLLLKGSFEKKLTAPAHYVIWWLLFVVFGMLSAMWAIQQNVVISRIPTAVGLLLLFIVAAMYKFNRKEYDMLKWFILMGGLTAASMIIYNFITGNYYHNYSARATLSTSETVMDPNKLAFDLLIPLSICTGIILQKNNKALKMIGQIIFFPVLAGIFLTGSRGGILGAAVMLVTYFMTVKRKFAFGIFLITLSILLILVIPDALVSRFEFTLSDRGAGRLDIYIVAYNMIKQYWLTGVGLDNFPVAYTEFSGYAAVFQGTGRAAHNIYLNIFVELGIAGVCLLLLSMIKHYKAIKTRNAGDQNEQIMLKASFYGVITSSLFLNTLWTKTFWLLWILIMIHRKARD